MTESLTTTATDNVDATATPIDIRHLSDKQLAALGMAHVAYIRAITVNGDSVFAIHAADGTPMALAPDLGLAVAAVQSHEMVPALVH